MYSNLCYTFYRENMFGYAFYICYFLHKAFAKYCGYGWQGSRIQRLLLFDCIEHTAAVWKMLIKRRTWTVLLCTDPPSTGERASRQKITHVHTSPYVFVHVLFYWKRSALRVGQYRWYISMSNFRPSLTLPKHRPERHCPRDGEGPSCLPKALRSVSGLDKKARSGPRAVFRGGEKQQPQRFVRPGGYV